MKQVIAEAGKIKVIEVPVPQCKDTEVLVRSEFSLISTGTETWTLESTRPIGAGDLVADSSKLKKAAGLAAGVLRKEGVGGLVDYVKAVRNPEVALGYSLSGAVVRIGKNVTDLTVGDHVACAGEGYACHAEYVAVPRNLVTKVPEGVSMRDAAFSTLGAIAIHGFRRSGSALGETVAVIGAGLVGNLVVQVCKAAGCRVVALDVRKERLELAERVGAGLTLEIGDQSLLDHILHFSNGRGVDGVIVCASGQSNDPVNLASKLARDRAKVTIVGRVGMDFDRKDYYQKELDVSMSRSLGPGRYDVRYEEQGSDYPLSYVRWTLNRNIEAFLDMLLQGSVSVGELVGQEYPIERASEAYEALKTTSKVALMLRYSTESVPAETFAVQEAKKTAKKDALGVALVGPGNYAKEILLPLLRRNRRFTLRWVVSSDPLHARQAARRYHFENFATDLDNALGDPQTDLVVICTPNNTHAQMAIRCARAGKAAFIEKPLCITVQQLEEVIQTQSETRLPMIVGFNRRYAPLVLRMKERLARLDGPILINYRVNTDLVPSIRWSQDPSIGGGRVIHEACHFFDLFNFLVAASGPKVSVTSTDVNSSTAVARDNFVAVLKYPNGSVASLTYSSLGTKSMDRERIEVFAQGQAFVLSDFVRLNIYGVRNVEVNLRTQDKGHARELEEVFNALTSSSSRLITFGEAVEAMRTTFEVDSKLRELEGLSREK
ncbi:MAG: bi-domain-containing oxidoreductase [Thaumarchaeota archaeon]|nr:bi-domain-containing oxidoreductase [Nitrososphaerota archaeon]